MFCSEYCQQKSLSGFHFFKCAYKLRFPNNPVAYMSHQMVECLAAFDYNIKELKKFLKANEDKNLLDFDLSDSKDPMYEKNKILILTSMKRAENNSDNSGPSTCGLFAELAERSPKLNQMWTTDKSFLSRFFPKQVFNHSITSILSYANVPYHRQSLQIDAAKVQE